MPLFPKGNLACISRLPVHIEGCSWKERNSIPLKCSRWHWALGDFESEAHELVERRISFAAGQDRCWPLIQCWALESSFLNPCLCHLLSRAWGSVSCFYSQPSVHPNLRYSQSTPKTKSISGIQFQIVALCGVLNAFSWNFKLTPSIPLKYLWIN